MIINEKLLDTEGLLLLHYKQLNIDEYETMILLLILRLERDNTNYITPMLISKYMTINEKQIDRYVVSLINKQLLVLEKNSLNTRPLINAILKINIKEEKEEAKKINLVELFESEFGRSLTPIEIEILKEWKQCQYSNEMIIEALKEATLSHVHNMRYIEKILVDWAKHGMKKTGREKVESSQKVVNFVDYEWWND